MICTEGNAYTSHRVRGCCCCLNDCPWPLVLQQYCTYWWSSSQIEQHGWTCCAATAGVMFQSMEMQSCHIVLCDWGWWAGSVQPQLTDCRRANSLQLSSTVKADGLQKWTDSWTKLCAMNVSYRPVTDFCGLCHGTACRDELTAESHWTRLTCLDSDKQQWVERNLMYSPGNHFCGLCQAPVCRQELIADPFQCCICAVEQRQWLIYEIDVLTAWSWCAIQRTFFADCVQQRSADMSSQLNHSTCSLWLVVETDRLSDMSLT